ncbi:hypothetical protein GCM10011607_12080 [Shewanella inventionis]|uniref:Uncharacterized protein n=1 Tax=Shewanella inventionis TaxID=1738770 RepID=A0ABQ1IVV4_9GAMM|nr:hypothetical protein [Shewanella inventionis]GGB53151.1 hypothetical protein GCM10011607_12080 [Shewanella inventionis]
MSNTTNDTALIDTIVGLTEEHKATLKSLAGNSPLNDDELAIVKQIASVAAASLTISQQRALNDGMEDEGFILFDRADLLTDISDHEATFIAAFAMECNFVERIKPLAYDLLMLSEDVVFYSEQDIIESCFNWLKSIYARDWLTMRYYLFTTAWVNGDTESYIQDLYNTENADKGGITLKSELERVAWEFAQQFGGEFDKECYGRPCFDKYGFISYPENMKEISYDEHRVLLDVADLNTYSCYNFFGNGVPMLFDIDAAMLVNDEDDDDDDEDGASETFNVTVTGIVYDEGNTSLPQEMTITVTCELMDIEDTICEEISNLTGFSVSAFAFDIN